MKIRYLKKFSKERERLIKKGKITRHDFRRTIRLYLENSEDSRRKIRWHKIHESVSISIPDTQYRMILTEGCTPKMAIFHFIGDHDKYDIIVKRKTKHIRHDCP